MRGAAARSKGVMLCLVTVAIGYSGAGWSEPVAFYRPLVLDGTLVRWQGTTLGKPATVRYRLVDRTIARPAAQNCKGLQPFDRLLSGSAISAEALTASLRRALLRWERVADITFVEARSEEEADLLLGEQVEPEGRAFASIDKGPGRSDGVQQIQRAFVCLNPVQSWKIGFDGDLSVYDLVHTLTHEVGHVIGLDHPRGTGHVMSRRYDESALGLSQGDIAGAVALYGPPRAVQAARLDLGPESHQQLDKPDAR